MCWSCDLANSIARTDAGALAHFRPAGRGSGQTPFQSVATDALGLMLGDVYFDGYFSKDLAATGFVPDGVGDRIDALPAPTLLELAAAAAVAGDLPNDETTTGVVVVGGARVISTLETPGDQDWFAVELQAGITYEIGQYATRFGPSGVPLRDPLVELYDSNGNLLSSDDSGGPDNNVSDDALIVFTPEVTGTYYINARAWDTSDPVGLGIDLNPATTTGDYVGDYEVFARVSTLPPDYYEIRYETVDDPNTERNEIGLPTLDSSPLHAIDWQTQFDGTSRNPDGAEGPRVTGNEVESKIGGKNVIYYYFAREGEVFVDGAANPLNLTTTIVAQGMQEWEKNSVELALDRYEEVADIVYVETEDRYAADIVVVTYSGTPGPGVSLLGRMSPPDTPSEGQTEYNAGDERWNQQDLAPGGFYFATLIHELGHGHGMSHPHDDGGRSSVMRGVEEVSVATYTLGDFDLNQGVFTMMSYQDGWQTSPYGQPTSTDGYGFIGSLMAMDIAVIQDKYGVNEEWATGDDTYVIVDENRTATFNPDGTIVQEATSYKSIWDAGGNDSIVYGGARNTNIDLRAATLRYEEGGGGWVSYAFGIFGGFTIANSVTIENAYGGSGNDTLTGNDVANLLHGGGGADVMAGGLGHDTYNVDNALDSVIELAGGGDDRVYASVSFALAAAAEVETLGTTNGDGTGAIDLTGSDTGNSIYGNAGANVLNGAGGADALVGLDGNDLLIGGAGNDVMRGGAGNDAYRVEDSGDAVFEGFGEGDDSVYATISYTLSAGALVETLGTTNASGVDAISLTGNDYGQSIYGNAGANRLHGDGGADHLVGLEGDDVLIGGGGADALRGGAGNDEFRFDTNLGAGNIDAIIDYSVADDVIALDDAVFAGLGLGTLSAAAFRTGATAQDADDRIIYDSTTGALYFDADGNGGGAAVQFATVQAGLALTNSEFQVI